ncbi:toxin HicA, partial [Peptococcaceae bacterium SCADC1_2_3]
MKFLADESIDLPIVESLRRDDHNERIKGDHHIFTKEDIIEIINLQPLKDGKAKAYQVKQVRNLILKYKLHRRISD